MPIYEFACNKKNCETKKFEQLCMYEECETMICPTCKSNKFVEKLVSLCGISFANPLESSKSDRIGYMADYNLERAKAERRYAEGKSHVGATPYGDINDIEKYGEGIFDPKLA